MNISAEDIQKSLETTKRVRDEDRVHDIVTRCRNIVYNTIYYTIAFRNYEYFIRHYPLNNIDRIISILKDDGIEATYFTGECDMCCKNSNHYGFKLKW